MILLPHTKGQKIGVYGLGISGLATVRALCASGAEVYAWDENEQKRRECEDQAPAASYSPHIKWPWKEIDSLILSPGVPLYYPQPHPITSIANIYGCKIMGDVELLMESQPNARYIGITGTNGKSTTTALTYHLLDSLGANVQVGGNIGRAVLDLEPFRDEEEGIYVLEMSSYQLDLLIGGRFTIAALLNITPDHIDRHGDLAGYVQAKQRIFQGMGRKDTAIISIDDTLCKKVYNDLKSGKSAHSWQNNSPETLAISTCKPVKKGVWSQEASLHCDESDCIIDLADCLTLKGDHNNQNAAVAAAIVMRCGYQFEQLVAPMLSFKGLPHRMQPIGKYKNTLFINDSKATNAEAASHALKSFENIYWIAGGVAKEGGIEPLSPYFNRIAQAYLIGEAAQEFSQTLKTHKVSHALYDGLDSAMSYIAKDIADLSEDACVLLSPACASFDQFDSFEHRGEYFVSLCKKIFAKSQAPVAASDDTIDEIDDDIIIIPRP